MANINMHNGIDLTPPKFLRRRLTPESKARINAMIKQLNNPAVRQWSPIRKPHEIAPRPTMPMQTDHPDLPVKVQVKKGGQAGSMLLATYKNMAAFTAGHDHKTYPPIGQPMLFQGHNVILVRAKPWAGKERTPGTGTPKGKQVWVNGKQYESVAGAFRTLGLPWKPQGRKLRRALKKTRTMPFSYDGKDYVFSLDEQKPVVETPKKKAKPAPVVKAKAKAVKKKKQ
jgi:hypothetical protein